MEDKIPTCLACRPSCEVAFLECISHNPPSWYSFGFAPFSHLSSQFRAIDNVFFLPFCCSLLVAFFSKSKVFSWLHVQTSDWLGLWLQRRMWLGKKEKTQRDAVTCFKTAKKDTSDFETKSSKSGFASLWGLKTFPEKYWWLLKEKINFMRQLPLSLNIRNRYIVSKFFPWIFVQKESHVNLEFYITYWFLI